MPEKPFKPTEQEIYDGEYLKSVRNASSKVLDYYSRGELGKYSGDGYLGGASGLKRVPLVGPGAAKWLAEIGWDRAKMSGGREDVEAFNKMLDLKNAISELQTSKVSKIARSTFTDAQVKRIEAFTPDITNDEKTNLFYAIGYRMEAQLADSIRRNPEIKRVLNEKAKAKAAGSDKTVSVVEERKKLEDELIDLIGKGEGANYKEYLTRRFEKNPRGIREGHFSPLVYAGPTINDFLKTQKGYADLDDNGAKVKKLPDGSIVDYDFVDAPEGLQSTDLLGNVKGLPKSLRDEYRDVLEDIEDDYHVKWLPKYKQQIIQQQNQKFGKVK